MKKQETLEVKYIKFNNALIIAFICLLIGFIAGNIYSVYKGDPSGAGSQFSSPGVVTQAVQQDRIQILEKEVNSNPDNTLAWLELGNLYFDSDQPAKSIQAYDTYLKKEPGNPNVWTDLGIMYRRNSQFVQALDAFNKAATLSPRHEQSLFNKGIVLLYDMKDKEAALEAWRELEKINPLFVAPNGRNIKELIDSVK